jgi:prevent-host-death family protein
MRTITAAEASRNFPGLLDSVEHGEAVIITRGGHAVAEIRPAPCRSGADLRTALAGVPPPDESFAAGIADALTALAAVR